MSKGNVLLVSFHFYPSHEVGAKRPSETALQLLREGYQVTVLRAWDKCFAGRPVPTALERVEIISIRIPRRLITAVWIATKDVLNRWRRQPERIDPESPLSSGATPAARLSVLGWLRRQLLAYDTLFQGNKRWLCRGLLKLLVQTRGRQFDVVIASGPPMVSYICGWAAARLKRCKLILDYRDPWYLHGDKELTTVMLGHPLARFENNLARKCAADCAALVAASPGTKKHILERFAVPTDRVHVIRNGFDAPALVEAPPPNGRLSLLYAGSLYWNRNPFPFLEALEMLVSSAEVDRTRVICRFAGNCEEWKGQSLVEWIQRQGLGDVVQILPFMSAAALSELVVDSNVLINFAQGQPRQIPAKSYEYIASLRDVLVITENDSDVAELFREARIGEIVEPGDTAAFGAALADFYRKHVENCGPKAQERSDIRTYSREAQLERFLAIVNDTLAKPDPSATAID